MPDTTDILNDILIALIPLLCIIYIAQCLFGTSENPRLFKFEKKPKEEFSVIEPFKGD